MSFNLAFCTKSFADFLCSLKNVVFSDAQIVSKPLYKIPVDTNTADIHALAFESS